MRNMLWLFALVPTLALAATPKVTTDSDPSANFSSYKTYYWSKQPDGGSPLMQQRVVNGVNARLQAQGWTLAPDASADVAIAAHVATSQKQSLDTFYTGTPMGGWGWRGGWGGFNTGMATTNVHTFNVGTLVIDMFDNKSHQAVWRGTMSGTVPSSPTKADDELEKGLDKLFAQFPPQPGAKKK